MRNLDFEIKLLKFENFLGAQKWVRAQMSRGPNGSGPKWVGAQMCWGPNESGPKWVGAQMSWGPNVLGPKWVGAQMCRGPNELGPKCVGAQMSQGPKWVGPKWVRGPNEEWAQMCPSPENELRLVLDWLAILKKIDNLKKSWVSHKRWIRKKKDFIRLSIHSKKV